jgi:surfactin synthase thioesterase subunit
VRIDRDNAFRLRKRRARPTLRLFCLPFAGGTAGAYRLWHENLPEYIEVCPVEYPGHGARTSEPLAREHGELVSSLHESMQGLLDLPVALFGHSMGAGIAFELARRLGDRVVHLFASASEAPDYVDPDPGYVLDDARFLERIGAMGGTSSAILEDPELMAHFLLVLRADFRMSETYVAEPGAQVRCPLTTFAGTKDETVAIGEAREWSRFTTGPSEFVLIDGGHFFHESERTLVTGHIARSLAPTSTPALAAVDPR